MFSPYIKNLTFSCALGGITPVDRIDLGDYRTYPHWILIAPKGGSVNIEIENNSIEYCNPKQTIVIQPNIRHRFHMASQSGFISRWAHVNFLLPGNIDIEKFLNTPVITSGTNAEQIGSIIEQLTTIDQNECTLQAECRFLRLGFSLLDIICSISTESDNSILFSDQFQRIRDVLVYIDNNLDNELTRNSLADYCGLSNARFHVIFHKCTGMAPMEFVKYQRMEKAKYFLTSTDNPISGISQKVGYDNPYTFSRAFKNAVGLSPSFYRLEAKRQPFIFNM